MTLDFCRYVVSRVERETSDICTVILRPKKGVVDLYSAGQFFILKNINVPSEIKHNFRSYSVLRAYREDEICFGIKNKGPFTNSICSLEAGQEVELRGPFGLFRLPEDLDAPFVFLGAGVGITPLFCMIEELTQKKQGRDYYLLYSNKTEEDIAYREELEDFAKENGHLKIVHTLTRQKDWEGERGRIDFEMIERNVPEYQSARYFLCGPKAFVEGLSKTLIDNGIPKKRVHLERW